MPKIQQEERINIRLPKSIKELIERAARLRGQNLTSFTVSILSKEAEQIVEQNNIIKLSQEDWDIFAHALENPPKPNQALKRAKAAHKKWVAR